MLRQALLLAAILASLPAASGQEADTASTLRYSILVSGHKAGSEVDAFYANPQRLDSTFEYNDRGRGPKIHAQYQFGPDSMPARVDISGVDYLKTPVDEHFAISGGEAKWRSTAEDGHAPAGAFYSAINSPSAEAAVMAQALKKAGPAGVKVFPGGTMHLEKLAETTVHASGQSAHVTEYAISGLGFSPSLVWLDDQMQLFALPGTWAAVLREGWESTNDELYALQTKSENERFERLARELTHHPAGPVAIEHVRLYDSMRAEMVEDQTVIVDGSHIAAAGPAASVTVPPNAERIDGHGKTLLPGLFDMHAHASSGDGLLNIASGVTTIRDMGNNIEDLAKLEDQWRSGTAIGPRVWKAGLIDGSGPYQAPIGNYVDTQAEANAAVNHYADLGYIQTKIYSSLNPAFLPEIIYLSHARGMRVSGHIPNGMTAAQFVEEGADEIQHINFIFLNFFADRVKDTRSMERFTAVGQYAAGLDLDSKPVNDFIALLLQHHTTVDVTLATFEGMFTARPRQVSPDWAPVLNRMPTQVQRQVYTGGLQVTEANDQTYRDSWAAMLKMTRRLYDAGVPILAGTDATAGLMLHRELELEVQAGIPPLKALQIATLRASTLLRQQSELGSIETGKLADLLLVEGNPGTNISDIRRCRTVFKSGAVFDSAKLYQALGILPAP